MISFEDLYKIEARARRAMDGIRVGPEILGEDVVTLVQALRTSLQRLKTLEDALQKTLNDKDGALHIPPSMDSLVGSSRQRVYLAGPMSGLPELNFPAFFAQADKLRARGYEVINPAEISSEINPDDSMSWAQCMRAGIAELVKCDAVALLPGWQLSKGATLEYYIAQRLEMYTWEVYSDDKVL